MGDGEELGWVTYGRARQLMTRADFLLPLDHLNMFVPSSSLACLGAPFHLVSA
jgi:hypothetical protein